MNPYSQQPLEPWVELAPARWFRTESLAYGTDVQIREIVETHYGSHLEYRGYGPTYKANGRLTKREEKPKATWLWPSEVSAEIRAELARRRALLEAHHGRKVELRTLPVAAVPPGAVVKAVVARVFRQETDADHPHDIAVAKIESSTPRAGLITWRCGTCDELLIFGAADKAEIVSLP